MRLMGKVHHQKNDSLVYDRSHQSKPEWCLHCHLFICHQAILGQDILKVQSVSRTLSLKHLAVSLNQLNFIVQFVWQAIQDKIQKPLASLTTIFYLNKFIQDIRQLIFLFEYQSFMFIYIFCKNNWKSVTSCTMVFTYSTIRI